MRREFVAVVGTVNYDVIVTPAGEHCEGLGGILYSVTPLAALLEPFGIAVRAYARLGVDHREVARELLSAFPNVDSSGLVADESGTNVSYLDYSGVGAKDRVERVEMNVAALSREDLAGIEGARVVLVNMISGRDVPMRVLDSIRASSSARFFLDVQALARTLDTPRHPRTPPDWEHWSRIFHVVRGNEEEIRWFAGAPQDILESCERILEAGAEEVLVTRGADGAIRVSRSGGRTEVEEIAACACDPFKDSTGCGDSFLAAICAGRLLGMDPSQSAKLGSWVASQVAGLAGLGDLNELRATLGAARDHFPSLRPPC